MRIHIDAEKRIHLYNRDFDEMRDVLDKTIQQTIARMLGKEMDSASITLKIDIGLERDVIKDDNADTGERPAIHPEIDYKINYTMQQKGSEDGDIVPRGSAELLVSNGNFYLVSREEASGQLSMFNSYDEYLEDAGGIE